MGKIIIPVVEIKIGNDLYLQIKDVSFISFKKGRFDYRPDFSYPDEPAECDWKNENAKLVIKKYGYVQAPSTKGMIKKLIFEKEFPADDSFVYEYYEQIILQIEEDLQNDR